MQLLAPDADWKTSGGVYTFPPFQTGHLKIEAVRTPEGTMRVQIAGMTPSPAVAEVPVDTLPFADRIPVILTWDRNFLKLYLKGADDPHEWPRR